MEENKFKQELERLMEISDVINENTELFQYIKQVNNLMYSDGAKKGCYKKYQPILSKKKKENKVFLSVILRSQGNRPMGLRESLLCLRAQTNQDFEIILIGHKAQESGKKCIREVIEEQPKEFQAKINYIELDEGSRTTPINVGFANASGKYIAIYDDDDLLFDDWVEKFYQASLKNNGKILHAFALAQKWKEFQIPNSTEISEKGYAAMEAPTDQFCVKFDYWSQLVVNKCPLMSLAFPSYLFQRMGMIFNEELNVTEDWEYFMRVAEIAGVADIKSATSIYRLWINAENSSTLHNQNVWSDTYKKVQASIDSRWLLIPRGYAKHIMILIQKENQSRMGLPLGFPRMQGILYYGKEEHFSDERMIAADNRVEIPRFEMSFEVPREKGNLRYFRFDPCEFGGMIVQNIKILITTENGAKIEVKDSECRHNGIQCEEGVYFMHYDPQIIWTYREKERIASVVISGSVCMEIPEVLVQKSIKMNSLSGKISRKAVKICNRIRKKE